MPRSYVGANVDEFNCGRQGDGLGTISLGRRLSESFEVDVQSSCCSAKLRSKG